MRRCVLMVVMGMMGGCANEPEPLPFQPVGTVRELMANMIDPAADMVWNAVGTVITEEGVDHWEPRTSEEWTVVRNGAMTLAESANLLMMGNRPRDDDGWMRMSVEMLDAGRRAIEAVDARDADAVFAIGEAVYESCNNCHSIYWVGDADRGRVQN